MRYVIYVLCSLILNYIELLLYIYLYTHKYTVGSGGGGRNEIICINDEIMTFFIFL